MKKIVSLTLLIAASSLPRVSFAASNDTIATFLGRVKGVLDAAIPFIIGLAVIVILWNVFKYIAHAAEEEKRAEAKLFVLYGVLGIFFMLSIWGFVNILINTFDVKEDIESGNIPKVPTLMPPKI